MTAHQYKRLLWIPVFSRLPQTDLEVLTVTIRSDGSKYYWILSYDHDRGQWYDSDFGFTVSSPIAWAYIPTYDLD